MIELAVGRLALWNILLALDEGGRIQNHYIEAFAALVNLAQRIECICPHRLDRNAVGLRIAPRMIQRRLRRVYAPSDGGPILERGHRPGADVTAHIEYARTGPQIPHQPLPVRRLVKKPTRLLSLRQRRGKSQSRLHDREFLGNRAESAFGYRFEVLQRARSGIVLPEEPGWLQHLAHGSFDLGAQRFHSRGGNLPDHIVAVAIQHEPRQPIRLSEHETIVRSRTDPLAQRQCDPQTFLDEVAIHRLIHVAADDARADQGVRIDIGVAEKTAVVRLQLHAIAQAQPRERRGGDVDLIAEDPQMACSQPAFLATLQAQQRQGGRRYEFSGVGIHIGPGANGGGTHYTGLL